MNEFLREIEDRFILELSKYNRLEHIAFVMDGNRRFAKLAKFSDMKTGHVAGSDTLKKMIKWCSLAGIKDIGAFAFSIENFKRPKEEVDFLMDLAKSQLTQVSKMGQADGYEMQVIGNIELLPSSIKSHVKELNGSRARSDYKRVYIYAPYTGTWEIFEDLPKWVPQIIMRTSGESRLSDFLTFQVYLETV